MPYGVSRGPLPCLLSLAFFLVALFSQGSRGSRFTVAPPPGVLQGLETGLVTLSYHPEVGSPPPNTTFRLPHLPHSLPVAEALPGAAYRLRLLYTNSSKTALLWEDTVYSEPEPPTNLTELSRSEKGVELGWEPPSEGNFTGFQLAVESPDEPGPPVQHTIHGPSHTFLLRNLTPGATYNARLRSLLYTVESSQAATLKFTTQPSMPGRFIVWFRNQTTMLVLWQAPQPLGVFDQYRVSVTPEDSVKSVLYVPKEGDPPGPVQAAFYGLVPGRAYTITVQTVSRGELSPPTEAQYRTLPLTPQNLTVDLSTLTSTSLQVTWAPPQGLSEFEKYQVSLGIRSPLRQVLPREGPLVARFDDLQPGKTYTVEVTALSGIVSSWGLTANLTTRPMPVQLVNVTAVDSGGVWVAWTPDNSSIQDSYLVKWYDAEDLAGTGDNVLTTPDLWLYLTSLLPGRNYSLTVTALSQGVESGPTQTFVVTSPAPPIMEALEPEAGSGVLRVAWKSDVTSRQDEYVVSYRRNDTGEVRNLTTIHTASTLTDLYPGASYLVSLFARSYGQLSAPLSNTWVVMPPRPPTQLHITKTDPTSIMLSWSPPVDSMVDHYLVRYRVVGQTPWTIAGDVGNSTGCELSGLIPGERYELRLNTVSQRVESPDVRVEQAMYPGSIADLAITLGSDTIGLEWQPADGRVDYYMVLYWSPSGHRGQLDHTHEVPANESSTLVKVEIGDLMPGDLYHFQVFTVSHGLRSVASGEPRSVRTLPLFNSHLSVVTDRNLSRTVFIKYTPTRKVVFDRYVFRLGNVTLEKLANDTELGVTFEHLVPGRLYNITAWTVSGDTRSLPYQRQARLYPEPVREVKAIQVSATSLHLSWLPPDGDWDVYAVEFQDSDGHLVRNFTTDEGIALFGLKPHHNYTFLVSTIAGYNTSLPEHSHQVSYTFATLQDVPGMIQSFEPVSVRPNQVVLKWSLPDNERNGILTHFLVTYYIKGKGEKPLSQKFGPTTIQGFIDRLEPGQTYVFEIEAHTEMGPGPKTIWELDTPIWAPPLPGPNVYPIEVEHTAYTITVRFSQHDFSADHGPIRAFVMIVAEDKSIPTLHLHLPTWHQVQDIPIWPPYQVSDPFYPFNHSSMREFILGSEDCKSHPRESYCNGPLKPKTTYHIKVRAFTDPDKYTDTIYSAPITTDANYTQEVILGVSLPLAFILAAAVGFVVYKRHFRAASPYSKSAPALSVAIPADKHEETKPPITNCPVKLCDFASHYQYMSADSDFRFAEQFEYLKLAGRERSADAADLSVNRPKNRFTNIMPYDHSRVKLMPCDDEDGSDYINANYVSGYNSPREFIVTQGPLHSTRDDFWRMVWEQHCRAIVMLTKCVEKSREKCDHYWPFNLEPVFYGDIQVVILSEQYLSNWTIRDFKVSRGEQSRALKHFHFTTWPDFGIPDPPHALVQFARTFREWVPPDFKPILVHCSAGVGRSGTFIALDRILQHIQHHDYVDIFSIVAEMRNDRCGMVQNEQQYICIHQCLLLVLEGDEGNVSEREIHDNKGFDDDEGIAESGL